MSLAAPRADFESFSVTAAAALDAAAGLLADAVRKVRALVSKDGQLSSPLIDREQRAAHGLAWLATYVEALRQL